MIPVDPAHVVGTGGAFGAVLRHLVGQTIDVEDYPLGTFTVNVLGSFLLAVLAFGGIGGQLGLFFGTGLAGSFTTFSSFSYETVRLWETGERVRAVVNAVSSIVGAVLAIGVAHAVLAVLG
ncbi:MAG: fluoride efflux transporter CrcB [Halobacteriota archaeon]